jgi:Pyridoxamine 5'-phosphate oxidase
MLPFEGCLRLLASAPVGRVAFCADGEVMVWPVNHAVDGQDVVFRTAHGSKLSAAEGQAVVTFEADAPMTRRPDPGGACWSTAARRWFTTTPRSSGSADSASIRGLRPWTVRSGSGYAPPR